MQSTRPVLVCLPTRDREFAEHVDGVMAANRDLTDPGDLQALLRSSYPLVLIRPSELEGLRTPTWYVYRDGHFPWPDSDDEPPRLAAMPRR